MHNVRSDVPEFVVPVNGAGIIEDAWVFTHVDDPL
jgi:hypothetical protein